MKILLFCLLVSCFSLWTNAQDSTSIIIGERYSMHSEVLDEERPFWVYLPGSYNDSTLAPQHYPVLYLLDGDAHFQSASGVVQFMSEGINANIQVPELIIVAIPNTDRIRDLTPTHSTIVPGGEELPFLETSGGGETFLRFIEDELIPQINSTYRTLPYRIFVGHSLGGLLVLHTVLEHPDLFQGMIAIDPSFWWDEQLLVKKIKEKRAEGKKSSVDVFITLANNPDTGNNPKVDPKLNEISGRTFAANLASINDEGSRSDLKYYASENHGSVPLLSLYDGLLFIFDGYNPGPAFSEFLISGPTALSAHFKGFSSNIGLDVKPPESFVNMFASIYASVDSTAYAIEAYKLNIENYPESWNAHENLANFYLNQGDTLLAIEHTKHVIELNPENEKARQRIQSLSAK